MTQPVRVLQVLGGMNRGGAETWLMHLLRNMDRTKVHIDFLVHTTTECAYDAEIKNLGSRILACPWPQRPIRYGQKLRRLLHAHGPYDAVHSHVHHFSGWVLRVARQAGVPLRIAHSHNDTREQDHQARWIRRMYLRAMERWIGKHATLRLAVSRESGVCLFGTSPPNPPWQVLYCGIDLRPFDAPVDASDVRRELGLPDNAVVGAHVGRFMEQKNHAFLMRIAAEVVRREPRFHLLLVGEGPLRASVEQQVESLGLRNHVHFLGTRSDVPRLLRVVDVFVLPSLHEGLPLVGMEVQAAGVPFVFTDTVTSEVDVIPELLRRVPLRESPVYWAEAVVSAAKDRNVGCASECLSRVRRSPFNIESGVRELESIYVESRGKS
jgi:glycosyltransferase involved in cell wall biosynthesis